MDRLKGKVAVITGASVGIGAATAFRFAEEGAKVVVVARSVSRAQPVADKIIDKGGHAVALAADIGEEAQIIAMVKAVIDKYGCIDVLDNNAALTDAEVMSADRAIIDMSAALWDRTMAVNLRGSMLCCKYVLPYMVEQRSGSIIITSSGKGTQGDVAQSAYAASKAGLINLMQNIATQHGKQGIRANAMIVGLVMTDGLEANFPAPLRAIVERHNLTPYLGTPKHIADTAVFLASDESAFITGQSIYVDGGVTAHAPYVADFQQLLVGENWQID